MWNNFTKRMNIITKAIKASTGLPISEFCEKELKVDYKAFSWRLKNMRLYPDEIFYLVYRTKKSVKELFGKTWAEMILDNSGGPMVTTVQDIIGKMSKEELLDITNLLGYGRGDAPAPQEKLPEMKIPTKRAKKEPIQKKPETTDGMPVRPPQAAETEPESDPKDALKKIFKNSY